MMQDFFDSRLLAMDTDFRTLSAQHWGKLPGVDLAYILDGAAYHTNQDIVARIRKGTLQVITPLSVALPSVSISAMLVLKDMTLSAGIGEGGYGCYQETFEHLKLSQACSC